MALSSRSAETMEGAPRQRRKQEASKAPPREARGQEGEVSARLPISLVEAVLGGRVEVETPSGRIAIAIPPGSSSGRKLLLRGRGAQGTDWVVELMVHVPSNLDEESKELIRRFAELNPELPR